MPVSDFLGALRWDISPESRLLPGLQQFLECFDGKPGIHDDSAHRECLYWIMSGDSHEPRSVGHYNVFALPNDFIPSLFQRAHGLQVIDPRNLGQNQSPTSISRVS